MEKFETITGYWGCNGPEKARSPKDYEKWHRIFDTYMSLFGRSPVKRNNRGGGDKDCGITKAAGDITSMFVSHH